MKVLNSEQVRRAEETGFRLGVSYETMMEHAGANAARLIKEKLKDEKNIAVVCGKGKNGGDGFVTARWLAECLYYNVTVILALGEPGDEVSAGMYALAVEAGVAVIDYKDDPNAAGECIRTSDVVIDAIFGIGINGEARGSVRMLISLINAFSAKVFSLDIPSGLDCDTNIPAECHVRADYTVAMFAPKPAHVLKPASYECGGLMVASIGVPDECMVQAESVFEITCLDEIAEDFPQRSYDSHKGDFGHVLSVCGSRDMPGAAVFAARAAVECGAGLVTAAFPDVAYCAIAGKLSEPLMLTLESNEQGRVSCKNADKLLRAAQKVDVVLIGCGLGVDGDTFMLTERLIKNINCPLIIDADGINIISRNINILKEAQVEIILTPHPGEMSRLCGLSAGEINADRIGTASRFAKEWGVTLVLKGANTVIAAPSGERIVNATGCPGMAHGGSGDALAGMIAAFIAQGLPTFRACADAVYLHGAAGERAAGKFSYLGATPSRLLDALPELLNAIDKKW